MTEVVKVISKSSSSTTQADLLKSTLNNDFKTDGSSLGKSIEDAFGLPSSGCPISSFELYKDSGLGMSY